MIDSSSSTSISYDNILDAQRNIASHAFITPLLENPLINRVIGGRLLIKAEVFQITGSFKFRGAFNAISKAQSQINPEIGVVAYSSGNHAQAVAAAAHIKGMKSRIVMPKDAPQIKRKGVEAWGGEIIGYDRQSEDRVQIAQRLAAKYQTIIIPPYDHVNIINGQGTCGLEIAQELEKREITPDQVIIPIGGGGLMAGCSTVLKHLYKNIDIIGAEPLGYDDFKQSMISCEKQKVSGQIATLADGLMSFETGEMTWPILRKNVSSSYVVDDHALLEAMSFLSKYYRFIAEPSGAATIATALKNLDILKDKTTVIVVSGGNVDDDIIRKSQKIKCELNF